MKAFVRDFAAALEQDTAAIFAGAGLSRASGFVDWRALLKDIADDLGLDVNVESDLVAVAQYHQNSKRSRSRLNQLLIDEFTKGAVPSRNHELIASLPLRTVWTTNYDELIENAFVAQGKRPDVKIAQENLATTLPYRDVVVYKMHGDISQPAKAVLTKDDYETYGLTRSLFSDLLKGDLISKTFVFLGFSFTDPNIEYILGRIRGLLGENQRQHYCIMRRPVRPPSASGAAQAQYEYESRKLELRVADLKRYCIDAVLVDDYAEITGALEELNRLSHRRNLFVSGSAHDAQPFDRDRLERLCWALGSALIENGYTLVSGMGLGIGGSVVMGALERLYSTGTPSAPRTVLRPFPQVTPQGMTRAQFNTMHRERLMANAGIAVFISGNKLNPTSGEAVVAPGVIEEFEIAKRSGMLIVPIGATGHAAQRIWQEVSAGQSKFYPGLDVGGPLAVLNSPASSDAEVIQAVLKIAEMGARPRSAAVAT